MRLFFIVLFVWLSSTAQATSIWEAKGDQHFILFGTFHLLREDNYPLPDVYDQMFDQCDAVWMEIDQAELKDPDVIAEIQKIMLLPEGQKLKDQLTPNEYKMLNQVAEKEGLDLSYMQGMKPWAVSIMLTTTAMMKKGLDPNLGLDMYLNSEAESKGIEIHAFETVMQQFQMFDQFDEDSSSELIKQTISDLNDTDTILGDMLSAWEAGDLEKLIEISSLEDFPDVTKVLLDDRNNHWMDRLFKTKRQGTQCIAVGTLHMAGRNGLLNQLRNAGYRISKP